MQSKMDSFVPSVPAVAPAPDPDGAVLQRSQTHRLVYLHDATTDHRPNYVALPNAAADEIEDLRGFVQFLYPPGSESRFRLLRPDALEPRWTVWDQQKSVTYTQGLDARATVTAARIRYQHETSTAPFTLKN